MNDTIVKLNNEIAKLKKELSDWKFSVNKLNQEKETLLKEIKELTTIKIKFEQDIKSYISELDQYENESKIMDKQISDLNCEINRLNNIIKDLMQEIENLKNQKLPTIKESNLDRNILLCEFIKFYVNRLLARHKYKFLIRLLLKRLLEKNKKIEEIKSKPITPQPDSRIKVVRKKSVVDPNAEIPGKVSYKRRNEIKKEIQNEIKNEINNQNK